MLSVLYWPVICVVLCLAHYNIPYYCRELVSVSLAVAIQLELECMIVTDNFFLLIIVLTVIMEAHIKNPITCGHLNVCACASAVGLTTSVFLANVQ